jgi:hypothetical protein
VSARGFDRVSIRIPDVWDKEWFRMILRDVLSKGDIRNATGVGVTITGNTDQNATITTAVDLAGTGVTGVLPAAKIDASIARDSEVTAAITALNLGSASVEDIGTSGATVPLLNGANTHASAKCTLFSVGSATPVATQAANADTSGATLGQLETEVNELKAVLRTFGIIAT